MSDQEQLERLRHHVEAALEYSGGTHNFDDVAEMVEAGRRGWSKTFLKDEGYSPQWSVMAKEL
jgi:hypothetical protein